MIPSALSQAKADPKLRGPNSGATLAAYIFCLEYLSEAEYRPVKIETVAVAIRCEKMSAVRAMRILTQQRYIAQRGTRPKEYTLLPAPLPLPQVRKPRAA